MHDSYVKILSWLKLTSIYILSTFCPIFNCVFLICYCQAYLDWDAFKLRYADWIIVCRWRIEKGVFDAFSFSIICQNLSNIPCALRCGHRKKLIKEKKEKWFTSTYSARNDPYFSLALAVYFRDWSRSWYVETMFDHVSRRHSFCYYSTTKRSSLNFDIGVVPAELRSFLRIFF